MKITNLKIRKIFNGGLLKAIVSVTLDDQLAIHDIKVIYAKEKLFLIMPNKKNPDGTFRDIVHPINSDFRERLEKTVLSAYLEAAEAAGLDPLTSSPARPEAVAAELT